MTFIKRFNHPALLAMISGILIGTSTIPFPPWALFFCLTPLLHIVLNEKPFKVFIYSALTFFIATLIGFFWMAHLLQKFAQLNVFISYTILVFFCFFYHLPIAIGLSLYSKFVKLSGLKSVLALCSVVSVIWLLTPMLFPWNLSINWIYGGFRGYEFMDIFGASGLHAITVFISGFVLHSVYKATSFVDKDKKKDFKPFIYTVSVLILFNGLGYFYGEAKSFHNNESSISVGIVQPNVGNMDEAYYKLGPSFKNILLTMYLDLSKYEKTKNSSLDLVVWPETAFPSIFYTNSFYDDSLFIKTKNFLNQNNLSLITGTFSRGEDFEIANSALFIDPNREYSSPLIHKQRLLAFGEYLPGETFFPFLRKAFPMVGNFKRGKGPQVKTIADVKVGILICYEALFGDYSRRLGHQKAQVLVNLTNDSWYGPYSEPEQHLYSLALRAIENRVPIIRSTNTGVSALISPGGKVISPSPIYEKWSNTYKVNYRKNPKPTLYQQAGHLVTLPALLIVFTLCLIYGKKRN